MTYTENYPDTAPDVIVNPVSRRNNRQRPNANPNMQEVTQDELDNIRNKIAETVKMMLFGMEFQ